MRTSRYKASLRLPASIADDECQKVRLELERARILAKAWADTLPEGRRGDLAALFVFEILTAFAREISPAYQLRDPLHQPYGHIDNAAVQLAQSVGRVAARLPILEGLHVATSFYPSLLPRHERGVLGAFYTPQALTRRLFEMAVEEGLDWRTARVLDPAAGGGAFLLEAADRMRHALEQCEPALVLAQLATRLLAFELDPRSASLAQMALEILLADLSLAAKRPIPQVVRICDTLEEPAEEAFDLVIGNPPYGRVSLAPNLRQQYARGLYGHANLYSIFTDIALRWSKPGGLVAYLTPTSFLAGQYYSALRGLLAKEAPPVAIDFVHARAGVFEDVLQETLLAVYGKGRAKQLAQIHYLNLTDDREAEVVRNGTVGLPKPPTAPWLAPRDAKHSALIARVQKMQSRLSTWGYFVSTGPLVWNRFKSQLRHTAAGKEVFPLLWAECVTAKGKFVYRAEKKNHAPYFKIEAGDQWLISRRPCVLVQRTTAKEQDRRLIAAELPSEFIDKHGAVVVENHLNMVLPDGEPKVSPAVLATILNSRIVDAVFRCMSGSVAVSAFELEALPLPDAKNLMRLGELVKQNANADAIEAECSRLYGEPVE